MNVLIVEDDDSIARSLNQALTEDGYTTQVVADGQSAFTSATTVHFDLIVLDAMLPKMNGLEVCRRLRETAITTPILIITARETLKQQALDSGADDLLVKTLSDRRDACQSANDAPTLIQTVAASMIREQDTCKDDFPELPIQVREIILTAQSGVRCSIRQSGAEGVSSCMG